MLASLFQLLFYIFDFVCAIIRIILFFNPEPASKSLFIPEPLNTILFFAAGFILVIIWIGVTYRPRSIVEGLLR